MSTDSYIHLSHAPAPGAPLVFAFHGTGGDAHQFFEPMRRMLPGAGVIAPCGDVSEHGANRFFKRTGEGVYDMENLALKVERMATFLRAHVACHLGAPVYGMGYSNGANILAAVMLKHPDIFDRAALLHPLIPWTPAAQPGLAGRPVLITGGRRDPICPFPLTERLVAYFKAQKTSVHTFYHDGGHELRAEETRALATVLTAP
jgi:phospholipase/carboxylesterase